MFSNIFYLFYFKIFSNYMNKVLMSQPSQSRQTIDVKLREPGTVETVK